MTNKWIAGAIKKPGSLRAFLHVKEDHNIPLKRLKVKESDPPIMKKRKVLAKTLRGFHK